MSAEFDLVASATAAACGAQPRPALDREDVDWSRVAWLAQSHKVAPLVASGLAGRIPDAHAAAWRAEAVRHAQRALHMVALLHEVLAILAVSGIRALAVKGPVLGAVLYGQPVRRTFADLDLWVARADLAGAADRLHASGFAVDARLVDAARRPSRFVQASLNAERDGVAVEIHGEPFARFVDHSFAFEASWARRREVRIAPGVVATLEAADTLHYLCLHGDWHTWERLQWIADVAMAAHRIDDASAAAVVARTSRAGQARILRVALRLARRLVPLSMPGVLEACVARPDAQADVLESRVLAALTADTAILRATQRFAFHLRGRRDRARWHYLAWSGVTASAADVAGARLPPQLSWMYPLWRIPGLLARHARPTFRPASRA